jgi:hypothetical protein
VLQRLHAIPIAIKLYFVASGFLGFDAVSFGM